MAKLLGLENVEIVARERPQTFFIPPEEERVSQKVGSSVRLHFLIEDPVEGEPRAERMWVTVTQEQTAGRPYKGALDNTPVYLEDLRLGDEITFEACHIAQTIIKKGDLRWIDSAEQKALVSKMCFDEGEAVRFLYREAGDRDEDSGWRMFTGHETQDYADDAGNIRIVEVGYMLDLDPSLLEPLKGSTGMAFERREKGAPWERVTDWNPDE